jgi:hypothetical protein
MGRHSWHSRGDERGHWPRVRETGALKIGVLHGSDHAFASALVDRINSLRFPDVTAEHVLTGGVLPAGPCPYRVIVDRVSHEIPFFRTYLKNAAVSGTRVLNNPFWSSADDRFFNYSLAARLGIAVPRAVLLPHKVCPPGTTGDAMRNLVYPLDWDGIFAHLGFPARLRPVAGAGPVTTVRDRAEFFRAYDASGPALMMLEEAIQGGAAHCTVVGRERVHLARAAKGPFDSSLDARLIEDSLTLCRALGYDINRVDYAVRDGVAYALDFMNPAPEADLPPASPAFDWLSDAVANYAIEQALKDPAAPGSHWAHFLILGGAHRSALD